MYTVIFLHTGIWPPYLRTVWLVYVHSTHFISMMKTVKINHWRKIFYLWFLEPWSDVHVTSWYSTGRWRGASARITRSSFTSSCSHPCVVDETRRPIGSLMSQQVDRRGRHKDDAQSDLEAHKSQTCSSSRSPLVRWTHAPNSQNLT